MEMRCGGWGGLSFKLPFPGKREGVQAGAQGVRGGVAGLAVSLSRENLRSVHWFLYIRCCFFRKNIVRMKSRFLKNK